MKEHIKEKKNILVTYNKGHLIMSKLPNLNLLKVVPPLTLL